MGRDIPPNHGGMAECREGLVLAQPGMGTNLPQRGTHGSSRRQIIEDL